MDPKITRVTKPINIFLSLESDHARHRPAHPNSQSATRNKKTTTARSGRYILFSATTSLSSTTKLDDGDKMIKNHAPKNPSKGRRMSAQSVSTTKEKRIKA